LEKHYESFPTVLRDELDALTALQGCVLGDDELTADNGLVVVVGKDDMFTLIEGEDLRQFLDRLEVMDNNDKDEPAGLHSWLGEVNAAAANLLGWLLALGPTIATLK
jgi:hypothetical protein